MRLKQAGDKRCRYGPAAIFPLILATAMACTDAKQQQAASVAEFPAATRLVADIASGDLTSVKVITELAHRARAADALNAFIALDAEQALARAAEVDSILRRGQAPGPLHGLPIVIKDNIHVAGLPNTAGTPGMAGFIPRQDQPVVAALRAAGAVVLGKTNLHELAFGITSNNAHYGAVLNPWDVATFAGGSSGGTAAAVAAGIAPAGLGTDTGGSVRIPAALTGVVGFRPSSGRYDASGVTPISHTRDTIGLIARSVADVILLDSVIVDDPEPTPSTVGRELRLGVPRGYYYANLDGESAVVMEAVLAKLETAGIALVEADPPGIDVLLQRSAFPIALYEVARDLPAYLAEYDVGRSLAELIADIASPDVKAVLASLEGEARIGDEVYADAMAARTELQEVFATYFEQYDLDAIVFPTTLLPSRPLAGDMATVELNGRPVPTFPTYIHNTDPASIAGLPAISLPAGLTTGGLPVGMELDGPRLSDRRLLSVAARLEEIVAFAARPPSIE